MKDITKVTKGITHAGKFHADDVLSSALLKILSPKIEIIRVNKILGNYEESNDDTIIFDIGRGEFDHHQNDVDIRDNGIKYASFGLLWREFGHILVSDISVRRFDEQFVQFIDLEDNTGIKNPIALIVDSYMPAWDEEQSSSSINRVFYNCVVNFAIPVLESNIKYFNSIDRASMKVRACYEKSTDKNVCILDKFAPFKDALITTDCKFVIYPSLRGGYSAHCIPEDFTPDANLKCKFPWGKIDEDELKNIHPALTFCHKNGFMVSCTSLNGCYEVCQLALEANQ